MQAVLETETSLTVRRAPLAPRATAAEDFSWIRESYGKKTRDERFRDLALPHLELMRRVAMKMTGDHATADDLVGDAVLRALSNIDRFQDGTNFKAWIMRLMTNIFINDYRRAKRRPTVSIDDDDARETVAERGLSYAEFSLEAQLEEVDDALKAAVMKLPPTFRDVFLAIALRELSYTETAEHLRVPVGTVMSRLFRAREILKKELSRAA